MTAITARPAMAGTSSALATGFAARAARALDQTMASAAPMSSPQALVSVPSYTLVGSMPGW